MTAALAHADQRQAASSEASSIVQELVDWVASLADCECLVLDAADDIRSGWRAPCDQLRHGGIQPAFSLHCAPAEVLCRDCAGTRWGAGSVWRCRRCTRTATWRTDLVVARSGPLICTDLVCTACRDQMAQVAA
jgi:hypothetical protein